MPTYQTHPPTTLDGEPAPTGRATTSRSTGARLLLGFGVAAGPVGVLLVLGQAVAVEGFDPRRHTISYLALGPAGWVQTSMFLLTGALYVLSAVGLRPTLAGGRGRRWAPIFVAGLGMSLVWAGLFPMDPADGFPVGTPDGPAASMSWHGALHQAAPVLGSLSLIGASAVLVRRSFGLRRRRSGAAYLVIIALDLLPVAFSGTDAFYLLTTASQLTAWVLLSGLLSLVREPVAASGAVPR